VSLRLPVARGARHSGPSPSQLRWLRGERAPRTTRAGRVATSPHAPALLSPPYPTAAHRSPPDAQGSPARRSGVQRRSRRLERLTVTLRGTQAACSVAGGKAHARNPLSFYS
jgi:hypothetical protein